jgi:hypothetical protein
MAVTRSTVEGAIEAVVCLDDKPGISSYQLYSFPDAVSLARRFTEDVTGARPALGVSDDACRPRSPGAKAWQHGWLACWIPEGSAFARLHWTDERTNTYGMLEAAHDGLQRIYRQWQQAYLPGDEIAADSS